MLRNREQYTAAREALLIEITAFLKNDPRFLVAWLAGSFGRGEQTWLSDLDIHVVVAEADSKVLCDTSHRAEGGTTPERLALFQQFGMPSIIFDAHANNLVGGSFTYVAYYESAQNVDWMLIPQHKAHLEHPSLLLFDKVGIPEEPEAPLLTHGQAMETVTHAASFFWMIAVGAAKYLEGDLIHFHMLLSWLKDAIRKVEYAFELKVPPFKRNWPEVNYTLADRIAALRQLCVEMEALMPRIVVFSGYVPVEPRLVVEKRIALFEEKNA